jgi:hypothetical protein
MTSSDCLAARTVLPARCFRFRARPGPSALLLALIIGFATSSSFAKPRDENPYPAMKREPARSVVVTNDLEIPLSWKLNPVWWFKNYDRPTPPWDYKPGDPHRIFKWYLRNPFHNFDFYVIGIADRTFVRKGSDPERVFSPEPGWSWAVCEYKWLRLPFVSYWNGGFNFYLGWRNRGQFGFELKYSEPKEPRAKLR